MGRCGVERGTWAVLACVIHLGSPGALEAPGLGQPRPLGHGEDYNIEGEKGEPWSIPAQRDLHRTIVCTFYMGLAYKRYIQCTR